MPILVNKNVFGFQISVDDVFAVEVREGSDSFSDVEKGCFLAKACVTPDIKDKFNVTFCYFIKGCFKNAS